MNHRWTGGEKAKAPCAITGQDGNVFNLLAVVRKCLKDNGQADAASEVAKRVMSASSYDEALKIMGEYVELE